MKKLFTALLIALAANWALGQEVITKWTFDATIVPSTGAGTAALIGGTTQHSATLTDGWRITTFPNQSENSGTAGASFMVSTVGFENIILNFEQQASNTMSRWAEIQYTIDGGDNWLVLANNAGALSPGGFNYPFQFDFTSISEVNDNAGFGVRVLSIFSPVAFNPSNPNNDYEANTAYHRANAATDGSGSAYAGTGNWRFLNVTFSGDPIIATGATKLAITSLNGGQPVVAGNAFTLGIQSLGNDDNPAAVDADTEVTLVLETGTGELTGNLAGTILEGTSTVTISGIIYSTVEAGVSVAASATGLTSVTTELFEVEAPTYALILTTNMPGAGTITGGGLFEEGTSVTVEANANDGFSFVNWTFTDQEIASTDASYSFAMPAEALTLQANFELISGDDIIHYWNFNALPSGTLTSIDADFSATGTGNITYPGTGAGYMDRFTPASNLNLLQGAEAGYALRLRNPADTREMILVCPSTGFESLYLTFTGHRSTAGAQQQELYYSINAGEDWTIIGEAYDLPATEPVYNIYNFDLTGIEDVNNNPNLKFKVLFLGSNSSGASGNQRIDNVSLTGTQIIGGGAVQLAITSVNSGNQIIAGEPFSISVQAQDEEGLPSEVDTDVEVTLTLESGSGLLSGTLSGTIELGTTSVIIVGVLYDTAEENVTITASADGLTSATSEPFSVVVPTYSLTLGANLPGAGLLTGAGTYEEGDEVTVTATPNNGFNFINWTFEDLSIASTDENYTFAMPAENLHLRANFEQILEVEIVHYWHFNNLEELLAGDPLQLLDPVVADYSANELSANITYPGTGAGYVDTRTHRLADPVSNMNLLLGQLPDQGAVLRLRNPANTRELLIDAPSTGFKNLVVTFATTRTSNGAAQQEFYYSTNGGTDWIIVGEAYDIPQVTEWVLKSFDLSSVTEVNDNAELLFKILFVGLGADGTSGNNRIDNLSVTGNPSGVSVPTELKKSLIVYPNPASDVVYIENLSNGSKVYVFSVTGRLLTQAVALNSTTQLNVSKLVPGVYIIKVISPDSSKAATTRLIIQ